MQPLGGESVERAAYPCPWIADGSTARDKDAESGLVHMRARQYDPHLERFTQTDPIQENRPFQHFSYAGNNPISRIDPHGLTDEEALARFKRNIPALLEGNEYGKRLYRMFEKGGWKLDAEWFLFDNYRALHSQKVLGLDTGNESKAINRFMDWLEDQFGQAASEEMFTEQLAGGQAQIESATALRSQLWHETQLYAKNTTASMLREGIAAATGPYGSGVNALAHAAEGNYEAALLNAVPLAVHGIVGAAELKPYSEGGGHHPAAKSAFRGAKNYNPKTVLAIPKAELKRLGIDHNVITGAQMTGYKAFATTGAELSWEAMEKIETEALTKAGMKPNMAVKTVQSSIQSLKDVGVSGPTRIPWGD